MTKQELLLKLKECKELADEDGETAHCHADEFLLEFINDDEIREAFDSFEKWYA